MALAPVVGLPTSTMWVVRLCCFYLAVIAMIGALAWSSVPTFLEQFPGYNREGPCRRYFERAPATMVFAFSFSTLLMLIFTLIRVQQRRFSAQARFLVGISLGFVSLILPTFAPWIPFKNSCVGFGIIAVSEVCGGISCAALQSSTMAAAVVYGAGATNAAVVGLAGVTIISMFQAVAAEAGLLFTSTDRVISIYFGSCVAMVALAIPAWMYVMNPQRRDVAEAAERYACSAAANAMVNDADLASGRSYSLHAAVGTSNVGSREEDQPLLNGDVGGHVDKAGWAAGAGIEAPCHHDAAGGVSVAVGGKVTPGGPAGVNGESAGAAAILRGLWVALRPSLVVATALFFCWVMTMGVYPGQLAGLPLPSMFVFEEAKYTALADSVWLTVVIGLFGCADCAARAVTPTGKEAWAKPLLLFCLFRVLPMGLLVFTVCPQIIPGSVVPVALALFGGATNGFVTSLAFSIAIGAAEPVFHDLTASAMTFVLTFGNATGTLVSLLLGTMQTAVCPHAASTATHTITPAVVAIATSTPVLKHAVTPVVAHLANVTVSVVHATATALH